MFEVQPRVVDEDVHGTKPVGDRPGQGLHLGGVADVARMGQDALGRVQGFGRQGEFGGVAAGDGDATPLLDERLSHGQADTAAAAGHEGGFVAKSIHGACLFKVGMSAAVLRNRCGQYTHLFC